MRLNVSFQLALADEHHWARAAGGRSYACVNEYMCIPITLL